MEGPVIMNPEYTPYITWVFIDYFSDNGSFGNLLQMGMKKQKLKPTTT